jgi:ABC-type uncharacterized transport system permease subunit
MYSGQPQVAKEYRRVINATATLRTLLYFNWQYTLSMLLVYTKSALALNIEKE